MVVISLYALVMITLCTCGDLPLKWWWFLSTVEGIPLYNGDDPYMQWWWSFLSIVLIITLYSSDGPFLQGECSLSPVIVILSTKLMFLLYGCDDPCLHNGDDPSPTWWWSLSTVGVFWLKSGGDLYLKSSNSAIIIFLFYSYIYRFRPTHNVDPRSYNERSYSILDEILSSKDLNVYRDLNNRMWTKL